MNNEQVFASQEEYQRYIVQALEEAVREANDPNTKWITEEEFDAWVEERLYELERCDIAQSA